MLAHDRTATLQVHRQRRDTPHQAPYVVALRQLDRDVDHPLPDGQVRITIGSGVDCDVVLTDPYASTVHCILERDGDTLRVRDRDSKNGTLLDGNRVHIAELRPGHQLVVGGTRLVALGPGDRGKLSARGKLRGDDPAFRAAIDLAMQAARSDCSILILGETGTGKELVARAIHEASARAGQTFVPLNCGGMPHELVASELFGHVRGAFTGADTDRDGVFRQADGGSLFLDEIGELPSDQQPHLLRALESRLIRPVGARLEEMVDVRLVAATNRLHLERRGSPLRSDLYHRLATVVVELPPLRERRGDIPLLVQSFLDEFEPLYGKRDLSELTMAALTHAPWPGNIRELRHSIHRAVALCTGELRRDVLLPPNRAQPAITGDTSRPAPQPGAGGELIEVDDILRDLIERSYARHGSVRRAAAALGMAKSTFADRARRLGLELGRG